jgi:hypothetical protein
VNRLVAGELKRRWNEALQKVGGLETRLAMMRESQVALAEDDRQQLMTLGRDLDLVSDYPKCPVHLQKRILRTVVREIIVSEHENASCILMTVHWFGGGHTHLEANRRPQGQHDNGKTRELVTLVEELATVCKDSGIVAILNRLRYRTGAGNTWTESRVQHLRHTNDIPACAPVEDRPWVTIMQAAEALSVSPMVIRRLIASKRLPARQIIKHAPWVIERKDLHLPAVRKQEALFDSGELG